MSRKCEKCVHYKICETIDDGIQLCCSGYNGCEMFEDYKMPDGYKASIIKILSVVCEEKIRYRDVINECEETINWEKIFSKIL